MSSETFELHRTLRRTFDSFNTAATNGGFGGRQVIWYDSETDVHFVATESRKDGVALGL